MQAGSIFMPPESRVSMPGARWVSLAIVALALVLRLAWLGVKPAHFDEGVNGWFVDEMTQQGFYHYDPTNFHGPLHFYVLFVAQTLFGRHEWVLRLPLALVSTACVALMLAFRPLLRRRRVPARGAGMAVSPGFVFYGRYAIHESELVFFMMLMVWGLIGLCHFGDAPASLGGGRGPRGDGADEGDVDHSRVRVRARIRHAAAGWSARCRRRRSRRRSRNGRGAIC